MKLEADISGSYVALRVPDDAFVDAGAASHLAGLEVGVEPDLRVGENERKSTHVSVSFSKDKGREIAVTLAQKLGLPAFTEPEWRTIANGLLYAATQSSMPDAKDEFERLADAITGAYS